MISAISPKMCVKGNYQVNFAGNSQNSATANAKNASTPQKLAGADVANALRAQTISFKGKTAETSPVPGIIVGEVEGKPKINAVLNGENRIANDLDFSHEGFSIKSKSIQGGRQITIKNDGKIIFHGKIQDSLGNEPRIEFNTAKHQPEIKVTLKDRTTIQLLEGSELKSEGYSLSCPGTYNSYKQKKAHINFGQNVVSLLCKKNATVEATNKAKETPHVAQGTNFSVVREDDPTFVVLAGGFGTRFANMTKRGQNKPSFVMPNGFSILSSAYDLIKNATGRNLDQVSYLEQNDSNNERVTAGYIGNRDSILPMKAYASDGGAVMASIGNKDGVPKGKPMIILNADTITNVDVSSVYNKLKTLGADKVEGLSSDAALVIPYYPVPETRAKSFGLMEKGLKIDEDTSMLTGFNEKPKSPATDAPKAMIREGKHSGEYYGNPGIYVMSKEVVDNMESKIIPMAKVVVREKLEAELKTAKPEKRAAIQAKLDKLEKGDYSIPTFLGNAIVPAIVRLCNMAQRGNKEGLFTADGRPMAAYMTRMATSTGADAYWDDIGSAEAFVHTCQEIAYESKSKGVGAKNKFYGIRGIDKFRDSVNTDTGVVFRSPEDKKTFERRHSSEFTSMRGDAYVTCPAK